MSNPNYVILYVDNPIHSANFYSDLLNKEPIESSPTFVLFELESGIKLGLWSKHSVEPAADAESGGGFELAISVSNNEQVHRIYEQWKAKGLTLIQEPIMMDFGLNFVAVDPDSHRLRVFALAR